MLNYLYGSSLEEPEQQDGDINNLLEFDQSEFFTFHPSLSSMDTTGFIYVPTACQNGLQCKLHISFHGCMQSRYSVQTFGFSVRQPLLPASLYYNHKILDISRGLLRFVYRGNYAPCSCSASSKCHFGVFLSISRGNVGNSYAANAGFMEAAEKNNIIVLFPQVAATAVNLTACWDWFGYLNNLFGNQIKPIVIALMILI